MPATFHLHRRQNAASTLIVVMFVITLLAVFIGVAVDYTMNTGHMSQRGRDFTNAETLANGALEAAFARWEDFMSADQAESVIGNYANTTNFNGFTTTVQTLINAAASKSGLQISSLTITPVDQADVPYAQQNASYATTAPLSNVPGWVAKVYTYKATAVAYKVSDPTLVVSISRFFQQADASLFQAMLFFQNDLELHPGANMTLYGLIHTNANFYAAAVSGNSLTFDSNVSYTGSASTLDPASNYNHPDSNLNGYIEGVTETLYNQEGTWGTFNTPVYATSRNSQLSNVEALYPLGTDDTTAIDPTNPNASGTHEIIERPAPVSATNPDPNTAYTDPEAFEAHRIWNTASLRILINRNNKSQPVQVYVPDTTTTGNEGSIAVAPGSGTKTSPSNIANQVISAITPASGTGTIFDFREGASINLDTVDMSVLTPVLNSYASSNNSYNGVIYISDITNADAYGNTSATDAIRLTKGGTLPAIGLTVASDGGVYVQGDYNTGTTYGATAANGSVAIVSQPVSNTGGDPTQYTVTGYTQKPASVMGDAVMVLSNNWVDSNSSATLSSRVPTPTTFNAAIVSGEVLTTGTVESGGAHNFPRFLENWSGLDFTYHGSMCELYASTHFTGAYGKSNVYGAPTRLWYFDNTYLTTPPPGNLRSTTYTRGRWVHNANS
jgi:Tfp pilus assembly protein PilX